MKDTNPKRKDASGATSRTSAFIKGLQMSRSETRNRARVTEIKKDEERIDTVPDIVNESNEVIIAQDLRRYISLV